LEVGVVAGEGIFAVGCGGVVAVGGGVARSGGADFPADLSCAVESVCFPCFGVLTGKALAEGSALTTGGLATALATGAEVSPVGDVAGETGALGA
jgi:hypothetical protein